MNFCSKFSLELIDLVEKIDITKKNNKTMEYIGIKTRKIDSKRRLLMPSMWEDESIFFVLIREEKEWALHPQESWKQKMLKLKEDNDKLSLAQKSYQTKADDYGRVQLPKGFPWKKIELIGMIDYIIIKESTG